MYLQLDPNKCKDLFDELSATAKKKKNKTLACVLSIYRGTAQFYVGRNDSAEFYFDKAIVEANKLHHQQLLSTAKIRKLFVIGKGNDSKIMLGLMQDEFEIAKKHKDTLNMIYSLNGIAQYHENLDNTEACIENYIKAIGLAQTTKNEFEYGFLLNNLGLLKLGLKAPEEGLADFKKGLKIAKTLNNIRLEITIKENIGYYYMVVDSLELAEKEFRTSYDLASKLNYGYLAFNSLLNLGAVEQTKENYFKSDSLLQSALLLAQKYELFYGIAPIYLNFAQTALLRNEYAEIPRFLDSALLYGQYTSRNVIQKNVLQLKYMTYQQKGDHENALNYYKELTAFTDSIDNVGHLQIMAELQLKYNVEKKEKQRVKDKIGYEQNISQQKLDAASLRQKINIGLTIIILLIAGFLIYYFREKNKRESKFSSALLDKLEEERGRIARDLHDGLGQSLVILKNKFHNLEVTPIELKDQIDTNFTETIEEVRSISRSLIPPELRRLGLRTSIKKMMLDIENASGIVATMELDLVDEMKLNEIQELTSNTLKHAGATSLKLEFIKISDGFKIVYQDNGVGLNAEKTLAESNSIGLKSIDQRLKLLNGSIKFEKPPKGLKAVIKIKHYYHADSFSR
jgi:signal transduction histidine kinase